ncbi:MAG: hypothetical protein J2P46_12015 [Zavarzinella sp.]|nr:hypothetical protein [Zavarzinella sp.]
MASHRLSIAALGATLLAGCVTTTKPDPARPKVASTEAPAAAIPDDPLPPGLSPKFVAFVAQQGLSTTPAKPGQAARLTAAWNNKVIYAPDPTHGGDPVPGLLARLYVFGPIEEGNPASGVPLEPDGELIVGLWDLGAKEAGKPPELMELWHIDRDTARKFRRPDFMGSGYTLFLPWSKYHVDLKRVNVVARYNGADGRCLVSSPETLTIDHSATLQRAAEKLGVAKVDGAPQPPKVETLPFGPQSAPPEHTGGQPPGPGQQPVVPGDPAR